MSIVSLPRAVHLHAHRHQLPIFYSPFLSLLILPSTQWLSLRTERYLQPNVRPARTIGIHILRAARLPLTVSYTRIDAPFFRVHPDAPSPFAYTKTAPSVGIRRSGNPIADCGRSLYSRLPVHPCSRSQHTAPYDDMSCVRAGTERSDRQHFSKVLFRNEASLFSAKNPTSTQNARVIQDSEPCNDSDPAKVEYFVEGESKKGLECRDMVYRRIAAVFGNVPESFLGAHLIIGTLCAVLEELISTKRYGALVVRGGKYACSAFKASELHSHLFNGTVQKAKSKDIAMFVGKDWTSKLSISLPCRILSLNFNHSFERQEFC
ncbi:hypothetical protein SCHPADRAFT_887635 [Schizopora paradoxa]|uniref:Uncharacterized protein n=1 Tax=Schizopora paradoxa TaxID=27342 RepID=A0A0H2RY64_9AGAM|nr:hypothetical protein SCHPADRAFT_887635 [Schizopora paradoxa]